MENNKFLNVIGMMSGTSIDGIDVSHLITDGLSTLKTKEHFFYKYSKTTFDMLSKSIFKYNEIRNDEAFINHLNKIVTLEHINALKAFSPVDYCDLIGFQTDYFSWSKINLHYNLVTQNYYLTILKNVVITLRNDI